MAFYLVLDDFLGKVFGKILKKLQFSSKMLKILTFWSVGLSPGLNFFKTFGSVWKIVGRFGRFFGPTDITTHLILRKLGKDVLKCPSIGMC